ncbi:MAG: HemY domain protein [Polaromonas sp.]|nr:HemY domain protein [Polaromonas sp.]
MRAALWFMALFGIAVAVALFAGNNQAVVTVFWPPHRVDVSFNLMMLLVAGLFLLLYLASRAMAALFALPVEARRWRAQQKERAMYGALMDAMAHLMAGRYIRSAKSAQNALVQEKSLGVATEETGHHPTGHSELLASQLRALAHLLVAESAQALQNKPLRQQQLQLALQASAARHAREVREGVLFRAAHWALEDRDAGATLDWLGQLPQGAARRTLALRMKLRAARYARQTLPALETARLLAKHRAFSPAAAQSILRGLGLELLGEAHDPAQLQQAWAALDDSERAMPEVAVNAAARLMNLHGDAALARTWLLPAWELMLQERSEMGDNLRIKLVHVLESSMDTLDADWLARIEAAQTNRPRDPLLLYLAGMACLSRQLWGKARQLLTQATPALQDRLLNRNAWRALAVLAEQRADETAAIEAYKRAAQF